MIAPARPRPPSPPLPPPPPHQRDRKRARCVLLPFVASNCPAVRLVGRKTQTTQVRASAGAASSRPNAEMCCHEDHRSSIDIARPIATNPSLLPLARPAFSIGQSRSTARYYLHRLADSLGACQLEWQSEPSLGATAIPPAIPTNWPTAA